MPSLSTFGGIYFTALLMMVAVTSTMRFNSTLEMKDGSEWKHWLALGWYWFSGFSSFYWVAERIMNDVR